MPKYKTIKQRIEKACQVSQQKEQGRILVVWPGEETPPDAKANDVILRVVRDDRPS